jgi:hypothetical protein
MSELLLASVQCFVRITRFLSLFVLFGMTFDPERICVAWLKLPFFSS